MGNKYFFLYPLIIAISFFILLFSIGIFVVDRINSISTQERKIEETYKSLALILTNITDAETGQRGFIITGEEIYLEPYQKAEYFFQKNLLSSNYPQLETLIKEKFKELEETINLRKEKGFESAQSVVKTHSGKIIMDKIRDQIVSIQEEQTEELKSQRESFKNDIVILFLSICFAFIIACIIFMLFLKRQLSSEANLKKLNLLWENISNSAFQSIITLDSKGLITSFNKGAEKLFQYLPQEIIGKPISLIFDNDTNGHVFKELSNYYNTPINNFSDLLTLVSQKEGVIEETWNCLKKDGSKFDFLQDLTLLKQENKIHGFLLMGRNVTGLTKFEYELSKAYEKSEIAKSTKERFLAMMSHELRTPLNSIIGFSNILLKNESKHLEQEEINLLKRILFNGKKLLNLLNSVLEFSKAEGEKNGVSYQEVDLNELIRSVVSEYEGLIIEKQLFLKMKLSQEVIKIKTDPVKLSRILVCLLGNAIKFTKSGMIEIYLELDRDNSPVAIHISDTGIGIESNDLNKIFETFYQADHDLNRQYQGSGLGLPLAKALCHLLNYEIEVVSEIGKGSRFTVVLDKQK